MPMFGLTAKTALLLTGEKRVKKIFLQYAGKGFGFAKKHKIISDSFAASGFRSGRALKNN